MALLVCTAGFDWISTGFISLLDGAKMVSFCGLRRAPWWGMGVVDPGRCRTLCVDRAWNVLIAHGRAQAVKKRKTRNRGTGVPAPGTIMEAMGFLKVLGLLFPIRC